MLRYIVITHLLLAIFIQAQTQIPTNCFEIESILVDACVPGSPCTNASSPSCSCEGKNEMVRFRVGPNDLNTANLTVSWPNNSWLGICQNATTASHVAAMNATVQNCGLFLEPVGGVLPAGREVLFITSTEFCVSAHSFANLSDTIIVIFQCAGNWQGHFANYGTGLRTLSMSFGAGCTDQVTYDRSQLLNQSLVPGAQDGARVDFAWDGTPTYDNDGCAAPLSPQIVNAGPDVTACPGDVLTFTANVQGSFSSYQWSGGTGVWTNANQLTASYQVGVGESGTIPITFAATNCNGSVTDNLNITITPTPNVTITPSGSTSLCPGDQVTLTANGVGSMQWSTGATTNSITVNTAGTYTVTATNACGSSSSSIAITSGNLPTATINPSGTINICQGDQVTLTASGGGNYQWSTGSTNASIQVTTAGNYTVTVSNGCGSSTSSVSVNVTPLPTVNITSSGGTNLCPGDQVTLTANGAGSMQWSTGATTNSITVNTAGTYTVTATNACGSSSSSIAITSGNLPTATINPSGTINICQGDQVTLTASGGGNYQWSTGSTNASIQVTTAGNYTVTVTNGCGSSTSSVSVNVTPLPAVNITSSGGTNLCPGDQVTLTANGAGSMQWNTGATTNSITVNTAGTYTVTVTNACGSSSSNIILTSGNLPNVTISASGNTTLCQGEQLLLTASGADTYIWNTGSSSTSINVNSTGIYSVIGSTACGSDTAFVSITVNAPPVISYTGNDTVNLCQGQSQWIEVSSNEPLLWNTGATTNGISVSTPGLYYVTSSNNCGTDTVFIWVNASAVTSQFTANDTNGVVPLVVDFQNNSSGATQYSWNMGDGSNYNVFQPSHTFTTPGQYFVTLIASNSLGCSDTSSILIIVDSCNYLIFIPNTFTPNEDGLNDIFEIKGNCIREGNFYVYNRWGDEIYSQVSTNNFTWNGNTKYGSVAVSGVYVYLIQLLDENGKEFTYHGSIHLFK